MTLRLTGTIRNQFCCLRALASRLAIDRPTRPAAGRVPWLIRTSSFALALLPFVFGLAFLSLTSMAQTTPSPLVPQLMPQPERISVRAGQLPVTEAFSASLTGYTEPRLERAVQRLYARLAAQTGVALIYGTRNQQKPALVIHTARAGQKIQQLGEDESYRLAVTPEGARLEAATPLGTLHGLETFLQLVTSTPEGFALPAVAIDDKPRFPWRGLLLDVCRHWMPLDVVLRTLDGMAAVKMNVLHWHLSEYQGFRVESKKFPRLQGMGSDGLYYTQAEIRQVIDYARDRGIRVIPEFDMPGHATSWFVGYPQLASAPGPYQIERRWGVFDPAMDPTRDSTYKFLDTFIGEMAALFPDAYFHIGGDEVNGRQWRDSEHVQVFMRRHSLRDPAALQAYFNQRLQKIVRKHHKIMVGWDEILHPDLPRDVVVQSWRGQQSLAEAARSGYRGLLSFGYYLDLGEHADKHYLIDPLADGAANLTPEQQARIVGGESCMWAEWISEETVDSRIWPRNAAIAERLWSPASVTSLDSMYERLAIESRRLEALGLKHMANYQPMLERIAGPQAAGPMRLLADAVEPVKGYNRKRSDNQRWPLNRLVDAARPESFAARDFNLRVAALLSAPANASLDLAGDANAREIQQRLAAWRELPHNLQPAAEYSTMGAEANAVALALAQMAEAAAAALNALATHRPLDAAWKAQQLDQLAKSASQPQAEVVLAVAPGLQKLIEAAPVQ
ncbi:MAG TPA: family 20 glycosylhydrolase [Terriglobales bacterium]|nr:family 20 glycosylhydrolase [Terriglobales bacterium]